MQTGGERKAPVIGLHIHTFQISKYKYDEADSLIIDVWDVYRVLAGLRTVT